MVSCARSWRWLVISLLAFSVGTPSWAQKHRVSLKEDVAELVKAKKYAEAEALTVESGEVDPFFLAWLKLKQGNKAEGTAILEEQISSAPGDPIETVLKSVNVLSDVSPEDAIDLSKFYLESAAFEDPTRLRLFLSSLYLIRDEPRLASAEIDDVLETSYVGPDLTKALFALVVYFYENQQNDEALAYFDTLMEKDPETRLDPGHQLLWARIVAAAGRPLDALKKIDLIQSSFPNYYETKKGMFHLSRGIAYEVLGDRKQAKEECLALVELAEEDPKYRGMAEMAQAKLTEYEQDEATMQKMADSTATVSHSDAVPANSRSSVSLTRILVVAGSGIVLLAWLLAFTWRRVKS